MTKNTIKIAGAMLSLLTAFSFQEAQAQTCVQPPSCESLGYNKTETDCSGADIVVKCPTDTSKMSCLKLPSQQSVSVGAILYGDGSVSRELITNKKPIGVVFDVSNRLAVALTDAKKDGSAGTESMYWSSQTCDVEGLRNISSTTSLMGDGSAVSTGIPVVGTDGRTNTNYILAATNCGTKYAANAVNAYQTDNCTSEFCQKGQWFLPSIRDSANISRTREVIDMTLNSLSSYGATTLKLGYSESYHTSTEVDKEKIWVYDGAFLTGNKTKYRYVRPVLAF